MAIYNVDGFEPQVEESAFVAESAAIIGKVKLGPRTSIWSNAVLRADNEPIEIGEGSNVQEGAVLHNDKGYPLVVGKHVSIGHQATLHGCTVGHGSLIGIRAIVLNGAVIGRESLVAAGALVTESRKFPDRSLIMGVPGKVVRALTDEEVKNLQVNAEEYILKGENFKRTLKQVF